MKNIFLTLLLLVGTLFAQMDTRLNNYPKGKALYQKASIDVDSAFELALLYDDKIKDYKQAAIWYEKSYHLGSERAAYNLGLLYSEKKDDFQNALKWYHKAYARNDDKSALAIGILYRKVFKDTKKAIKWYTLSYEQGNMGGANGLAHMYEHELKDQSSSIIWYKKAAKYGYRDAINNLGRVYHEKGINIEASAYLIALIEYDYTQKEVLDFLKNDWKIDESTIKKAYQLQKTLDIPKHYYDPEFEDKNTKKTGRH